MPLVISSEDMPRMRGDGWTQKTIVAAEALGAPALTARRLTIEPHGSGPERRAGQDREEMFYVIQGQGKAVINGEDHALGPESLLWLEKGDSVTFLAGEDGLEILHAYAPGA